METAQFAILAGLSVISIALCVYLLLKLRTVTYLLEQPVVKKMSPQLKLKPVKIDELDSETRQNPNRNANGASNRGPRPAFDGGERPSRDRDQARETRDRDRGDRGPRPERAEGGERPQREGGFDRDRGPRGDRGDRFGGRDRDRGGRGHDRHDRGGRDRNRSESFGGEREQSHAERPAGEAAPVAAAAPTLSPRRPLPSTVDHEVEHKEIPALDTAAAAAAAEDALFARDESDMQHGRRNQLKKKPRFEVTEEEAKQAEETKA